VQTPPEIAIRNTSAIEDIWRLFDMHQEIVLSTHERADGDGFGAMIALGRALEQLGKRVYRVVRDGAPENLEFLMTDGAGEQILHHVPILDDALMVVLDASELSRIGLKDEVAALREFRGLQLVCIDHHPHGEQFGVVNMINEFASSTCELVYDVLAARPTQVTVDLAMATALLTGIFTDTGSFQHSNTNPHALAIASELVAKGARLNKISKQLYSNKEESALRIWGQTLSRMKVLPQYGLAVSVVTQEDLARFGATVEDMSGLVSVMNTIPGITMSLLLVQAEPGKIKGSLRSEEGRGVDVSRIAHFFGGGGHRLASGFTVDGTMVAEAGGKWRVE